MNPPQFAKLLANLDAARAEEAREHAIDDLCWIFYSANWEVAEGEPIHQMLVNTIEHESNEKIRRLILEAIQNTYGLPDHWKRREIRLDLDPLVRMLGALNGIDRNGDMYGILYCLGKSGQSKYRNVCAEYLNHSDREVRHAAAFAVERLTPAGPGQS
jgi:hypothetical protein